MTCNNNINLNKAENMLFVFLCERKICILFLLFRISEYSIFSSGNKCNGHLSEFSINFIIIILKLGVNNNNIQCPYIYSKSSKY